MRLIIPKKHTLTLLLFFSCALIFCKKTEATTSKAVLYINSYHLGYTWSDSIFLGISSILSNRPDLAIYSEFMDRKRFDGIEYLERFKKMFLAKYRGYSFDVVAVSDNDALQFVLDNYDEMFTNMPVVFSGVSNPEDYPLSSKPIYGVIEYVSMEQELKNIFKIRPDMKNFYVITDGTLTSKLNKQKMLFLLKNINTKKVNIQIIDQFDRDVLMEQVQKIDPNDAIYVQSMSVDRYGNPLNMKTEGALLCRLASAPVFGNFANLPGSTATGGMVLVGRNHGVIQGQMIANLLDHPEIEPRPRFIWPDVVFALDYQQMKKYGINEKLLPDNIRIYNKPNGIFHQYKKQIFSILALYFVLLVMIIVLITTLRQKKKAKQLVLEQYEKILEQNEEIELNNQSLNDSNIELEVMNEQLNQINEELVEAKDRAEQSDKLKTYFLQNISHEIRTPLNAIVGFADLVTNEEFRTKDKERFYKIIKVNSAHLLNTMTNIIEFSKLQSGMYAIQWQTFAVSEIEQSISTIFLNECSFYGDEKESKLDLKLSFPNQSESFLLYNDPACLQQIFSVLLNNAVKFTPAGTIEVGFELQGEHGVFYVKDSGVGIKAEKFAYIFDSFWKVESLLQGEVYRGVGIGLSIVKSLVDLMQGLVWVESQEKVGTCVFLSLPVKISTRGTASNSPASHQLLEDHLLKGKRIAIVEDGTANTSYLKILMGKIGIDIIGVKDLEDIKECIQEKDIDAFLLDLASPQVDAFEACVLVKKECRKEIKVLGQSSRSPWEENEAYKAYQFDGFLQRPIYRENLYSALEEQLLSK